MTARQFDRSECVAFDSCHHVVQRSARTNEMKNVAAYELRLSWQLTGRLRNILKAGHALSVATWHDLLHNLLANYQVVSQFIVGRIAACDRHRVAAGQHLHRRFRTDKRFNRSAALHRLTVAALEQQLNDRFSASGIVTSMSGRPTSRVPKVAATSLDNDHRRTNRGVQVLAALHHRLVTAHQLLLHQLAALFHVRRIGCVTPQKAAVTA